MMGGVSQTAFSSSHEFITTWETTVAGETITIPTNKDNNGLIYNQGGDIFNPQTDRVNVLTYAYTVNWGDGTTETTVYTGNAEHIYANTGTHTVTISGTFPRIYINNGDQRGKIKSIEQWGNIEWASMANAFYGVDNLTLNATDVPNLSQVVNMNRMFQEVSSLTDEGGRMNDWDVSNVLHMQNMFAKTRAVPQGISNWDVGNVINMREMFFNSDIADRNAPDITNWDVSSVMDMNSMFSLTGSFNQDISGWDVSSVRNMSGMFSGVFDFVFSRDIGRWDVRNVRKMASMFGSVEFPLLNLGRWYITPDTLMLNAAMATAGSEVATFTAQNAFLRAPSPVYTLSGRDSNLFDLTDAGVLTIKAAPASRTYQITIESSRATNQFGKNKNDLIVTLVRAGLDISKTSVTTTEGDRDTFGVRLSAQPSGQVSVSVVVTEGADQGSVLPSSLTFDASDWDETQTVTVTGVDDDVDDGTGTYTITLSIAAATMDTIYDTVPDITLDGVNTDNETVPSAPQNLDATPIFADTIALAWNAPLNIGCAIVSACSQLVYQVERATDSAFTTDLTTLVGFNDGHTMLTFMDTMSVSVNIDYYYRVSAKNGIGASNPVSTNAAVQTTLPTGITLTVAPFILSESGGAETVTITAEIIGGLPTANAITVTLTNTANSGGIAYTGTIPTEIVISARATSGQVSFVLTPTNDMTTGSTNTVITIDGMASGGVTLAASAVTDATITLVEAGLLLSKTSVTTTESGGTDSFTVRLLTQPTDTVSVSIAVTEGADEARVSPDSLTFDSNTWDETQTVTVVGLDDNIDDDNQPYTITLSIGSAGTTDSIYRDVPDVTVSGVNTDNEAPTAKGTIADVELLPSGTDTINIRPAFVRGNDLMYTATSDDPDIVTTSVNEGTLTVTAGSDMLGGETKITVTAIDGGGLTATQTFTVIVFESASGGRVTKMVTVTGSPDRIVEVAISATGAVFSGYLINAFSNTGAEYRDPVTRETVSNQEVIASAEGNRFEILPNNVVDIKIQGSESKCTGTGCRVTFSYTDDDLTALGDIAEEELLILHYTGGQWEALDSITFSVATTEGKTISGLTSSFSPMTLSAASNPIQVAVTQLHKSIMTRFMQVVVANTNRSVESRIASVFSGAPQVASYQLDGQTVQLDGELSASLRGVMMSKLPTYAKSLQDGTMDWKRTLGNSSFVLPLNATDGDAGNTGVTVWGSGDYTNMSGKSTKGANLDWDGNVTGFQLGIDGRSDDLLTGGLVSFSKGSAKYTQDDVKGTYEHTMTSIHPYLAWTNGNSALWGSAGYGRGKIEIDHDGDKGNAKTTMLSLSGGVKSKLARQGMSVKGDISLVRTQVGELTGDIRATEETVKSQQLRVILESAREHTLESGGTVTPVLEVGLRYDGGSVGESGIGAILGAGARYANATGLSMEGKVHALVGQKNYKEWGVSGTIRQQASADGRGLAFSVSPSYGQTGSKAEQIWDQKLPVGDDDKPRDDNMRVKVRLDYGLPAPGINGLLIPYSEITVGEKSDRYLFGINWKRSPSFGINLSGERKGSAKKHVLGATWKGSIFDTKLTGEREESSTLKHRVLLESIIRF